MGTPKSIAQQTFWGRGEINEANGFKSSKIVGLYRLFFTNPSLKILAMRKAFLRLFALPLQKTGRYKLQGISRLLVSS